MTTTSVLFYNHKDFLYIFNYLKITPHHKQSMLDWDIFCVQGYEVCGMYSIRGEIDRDGNKSDITMLSWIEYLLRMEVYD